MEWDRPAVATPEEPDDALAGRAHTGPVEWDRAAAVEALRRSGSHETGAATRSERTGVAPTAAGTTQARDEGATSLGATERTTRSATDSAASKGAAKGSQAPEPAATDGAASREATGGGGAAATSATATGSEGEPTSAAASSRSGGPANSATASARPASKTGTGTGASTPAASEEGAAADSATGAARDGQTAATPPGASAEATLGRVLPAFQPKDAPAAGALLRWVTGLERPVRYAAGDGDPIASRALAELGLTRGGLHERALANLRRAIPPGFAPSVEPALLDDADGAAVLALPDLVPAGETWLAYPLRGEGLIVMRESEPSTHAELARLGRAHRADPHPIFERPVRITRRGFEPVDWPEGRATNPGFASPDTPVSRGDEEDEP